MNEPVAPRRRIAILSRYGLADQYELAAEFRGMLAELSARNDVLHLSFRSKRPPVMPPTGVRVEEFGMTIDRQCPRDIRRKFVLMYFYLPLMAWRLRRFKPDVVFISEILPLVGLFLTWAGGLRVATAYGDWHIHNMLGRKKWMRPVLGIVEWLDRLEVRRMKGLLCRAAAAGARGRGWGLPAERIRVVRDAPDPDAFAPRDATGLRARCGFAPDDVVLLYHGIMHGGKGLDRLISWTDQMYRENHKIGLILVGGGPEESSLRRQAENLAIGHRTVFTGWLRSISEVGDYCNAADLCIAMRTAGEANARIVPGALLHSMACRKVVLAPRLEGIAEIIREGENGYMFEADNGGDFQRLVRQLIADRGGWARVATNAWVDIQENYSVAAAATKYAMALELFSGETAP